MKTITRRQVLIGAVGSAGGLYGDAPPLIETHVHLFDPDRVPYAPGAPYKPAAYALAFDAVAVRRFRTQLFDPDRYSARRPEALSVRERAPEQAPLVFACRPTSRTAVCLCHPPVRLREAHR
jgi:hypothetical protein